MSSFATSWAPVLRYVREGRLAVSLQALSESEAMTRPAFRKIIQPLEIWRTLPRDGTLPHRRELRPERFAGYLPKLCIIEVLPAKRDFRWVLHGGEHEYWLGHSLKGRSASEFGDPGTSRMRDFTLKIYRDARPGFLVIDYHRGDQVFLRANTLCLPFSVDAADTGMLLCPTQFEALFPLHGDSMSLPRA